MSFSSFRSPAPAGLLLDSGDPLLALAHRAQETVETIGRGFRRRTDDWAPMLLGLDAARELHVVDIDGAYMANERSKDLLATLMAMWIREMCLTNLAFVSSTWMLLDLSIPEHEKLTVPPSQHPKRTEAVMVHVMDRERSRCLLARIHRMGRRPPRLGGWRALNGSGTGPNSLGGRFVDPLRAALADAPDRQ